MLNCTRTDFLTSPPSEETRLEEAGIRLGKIRGERLLESSCRLRHSVFCSELGWLPESIDGLESDFLDPSCEHIAAWYGTEVVAYLRLTKGPGPYLVDRSFRCHLEDGAPLRRGPDAAEISRLCIQSDFRKVPFASPMGGVPLSQWLFRETYRWCLEEGVRHTLFVTTPVVARLLRLRGFPLVERSSRSDPNGVHVLAELDWREFERQAEGGPLLDWFRG